MDLIADIGATNARCALLDDEGRQLAPEVYANAGFDSVEALLENYLGDRPPPRPLRRAALAVAAPIDGDRVAMVNIDWTFSRAELGRRLGVRELLVVNDFAALARALPELAPADMLQVGAGSAERRAPMAVVGPGTGLGVAGIVPGTSGWTVVGGEGGHVTLPAVTDDEQAVVSVLRERHGHCSAELLLSGSGLARLYSALAEIEGREVRRVPPERVTALAADAEPAAARALDMFFTMLGTVASDVALIFAARGGVFIGGGIVPRYAAAFADSGFRSRFLDKGDYRGYLESIPTYVVTDPLPALHGLRALLGHS